MNTNRLLTAIALGTIVTAPLAFGDNLTISDNNEGTKLFGTVWYKEGYVSNWYKGSASGPAAPFYATGKESEYMEVEPGMNTGAMWDLAAFVQPATGGLGILSGYDLKNGFGGTTLGDIFVTTDPSSVTPYVDPNSPYPQFIQNSQFNYEFAIHLNFTANTFTVLKLDANTVVENGDYFANSYNSASNPWRIASSIGTFTNGNLGSWLKTGPMFYTDSLSTVAASALAEFPVTSDYHYYAAIDMSWIEPYLNTTNPIAQYKLTMTCGNDNLEGQQFDGFRVPDNAATLSLLGLGLLAIGGIAKWRRRTA